MIPENSEVLLSKRETLAVKINNDEWLNNISKLDQTHIGRLQNELEEDLKGISMLQMENRSQLSMLQDIYNEWNEISLTIKKIVNDNIIHENRTENDSNVENETNDKMSKMYEEETEVVNYNTLNKKTSDLRISPLIFSKSFHLTKRSSWNPSTDKTDCTSRSILSSISNESFNSLDTSNNDLYSNKSLKGSYKNLPITPTRLRYAPKSNNSSPIKNNFRFFKTVSTEDNDLNYSFKHNVIDPHKDKDKRLMKDLKIKLLKKRSYATRDIVDVDTNAFDNDSEILYKLKEGNDFDVSLLDFNKEDSVITVDNSNSSRHSSIWSFFDNDAKKLISKKEKEKIEKIVIIVSFLIGIMAVVLYQNM